MIFRRAFHCPRSSLLLDLLWIGSSPCQQKIEKDQHGDHDAGCHHHRELKDKDKSRFVHPVVHQGKRGQKDERGSDQTPDHQKALADGFAEEQPPHQDGGDSKQEVGYADPQDKTGSDLPLDALEHPSQCPNTESLKEDQPMLRSAGCDTVQGTPQISGQDKVDEKNRDRNTGLPQKGDLIHERHMDTIHSECDQNGCPDRKCQNQEIDAACFRPDYRPVLPGFSRDEHTEGKSEDCQKGYQG